MIILLGWFIGEFLDIYYFDGGSQKQMRKNSYEEKIGSGGGKGGGGLGSVYLLIDCKLKSKSSAITLL